MNYIEFLHNRDKYTGEDHSTFLQHYGILGQKWGQRRWQNPDGTFNEEGKQRYFGKKNSEEKIGGLTPKIFSNPLYSMDLITRNQNRINQINLQNQNQNMINQINLQNHMNAHNLAMQNHQNAHNLAAQNHQNFVNQVQLQNHLQNTPGTFMGQPGKKDHLWESDYIEKQAKEMYKNKEITKEQYKVMVDSAKNVREEEKKQLQEAKDIENSLMDGKKISWSKVGDFVESEKCDNIRKEFDEAFQMGYQDEQNKLNELFEDYNQNAASYRAKAGILNYLYAPWEDSAEDFADTVRLYTWDDLDQGCNSSQYIYLQDKGYSDEQIQEMSRQDTEKFDQMRNVSRQLVEQDPVLCLMSDKAKEEVADKINWDKMIGDENYGHWLLNDADEGTGFDKGEHRDEMNKIYNRLEAAGNEDHGNGWWNLSQAVRNLKLNDKKYTELTDADWDAINAEVRELNKRGSNSKIGSWEKDNKPNYSDKELSKKIKLPIQDTKIILNSNTELYDEDAKHAILKNGKIIQKMYKAIQKGDTDKYMKLRNKSFDSDYEKDIAEMFIQDQRNLKEFNDTIKDTQKAFNKKGIDIDIADYQGSYSTEKKNAYPSDFVKHPENIKKYKDNCEEVLNNYDKFNNELADKLGERYYKAYLNTIEDGDKPLSKEQFKKTFEEATGIIYPSNQGNGALFEGEITSNEYGYPSSTYYFSYDLLNKTFDYIEEE